MTWLFLVSVANGKFLIYVAQIFFGLGLSFNSNSKDAIIVEVYRDNISNKEGYQARALTLLNKVDFIGMGISALLGSFFIKIGSNLNWKIASSLMLLNMLFISFTLLRNPKLRQLKARKNNKAKMTPMLSKKYIRMLRGVFLKENVIYILITALITTYFYHIVFQYWQMLSTTHKTPYHMPKEQFLSILFSLIFLAQAFNTKLIRLCDRYNKLLFAIIILQLLLFSITTKFSTSIVAAISIILYFWLFRATFVVFNIKLQKKLTDEIRATFISFKMTILRAMVTFLAPIIIAMLHNSSIQSTISNLGLYCIVLIATMLTVAYCSQYFARTLSKARSRG
jgi:MFS family permease